jgi:VWFA-related protein
MRLKWLLAVCGLALTLQSQDLPKIKVDVSLVNILCSVTDTKGALITGLTKDDFIVNEEGKQQQIRYFSRQSDLPLTLGLLVDVSGSQQNIIQTEKRAADEFFGKVLRKGDMAFLISFGADAELVQDSTNSVALLRRGLDNLRLSTGISSTIQGPVPTINQPRGTVLYDVVYLAAHEKLRAEVGRKAVVVITDGIDVGSRLKLKDAIEAAQKADTIIYSIHYVDAGFYRSQGVPFYGNDTDLRRMSEETGGRMFEVSRKNTLDAIFQQIQDEMRSQYAIGYSPAEDYPLGTYRRIEVRTKQKGLKVQARKGYYVVKPET